MEITLIEEKSTLKTKLLAAITPVVLILLVTAAVISIFAKQFEISSILDSNSLTLPIAKTEPEIVVKPITQPAPKKIQSSEVKLTNTPPMRKDNIQNILEQPKEAPPVSTQQNQSAERPLGEYQLGNKDSEAQSTTQGSSQTGSTTNTSGEPNVIPEPKPVEKPQPSPAPVVEPVKPAAPIEKPKVKQTLGVINSVALYLATPSYPATAKLTRVQGTVSVSVRISKDGKVTVLGANGNPLLVPAAKAAASQSKFSPTLLSKEAVEATGTIVYNFKL